jgi:hypothetical protein
MMRVPALALAVLLGACSSNAPARDASAADAGAQADLRADDGTAPPADGTDASDAAITSGLHVAGPNFYDSKTYDYGDTRAYLESDSAMMVVSGDLAQPYTLQISLTFPPATGTVACDDQTIIVAGPPNALRTSNFPMGSCTIQVRELGAVGADVAGTFDGILFQPGSLGGGGLPVSGSFQLQRGPNQ